MKKKFYEQQEELKHFGVLGMQWGKRKARNSSGSGGSTAKKVFTKTTDILMGKAGKAALARDVARGKSFVDKLLSNKAFKAMVFDKDDNTGLIFKKSEVNKLKSGLQKIGGKLNQAKDNFNRKQYQNALKTLAKVKARGDKIQEKELQDEINELFTPEERKRYSS